MDFGFGLITSKRYRGMAVWSPAQQVGPSLLFGGPTEPTIAEPTMRRAGRVADGVHGHRVDILSAREGQRFQP